MSVATYDGAPTERLATWLTVERAAYAFTACIALGVRLWALGAVPLTPGEAAQALPAATAVSAGIPDLAGVSPLLYTLQRLAFTLFGAGDASARLWAALLGGLSPLLFYFLRVRLGRGGALMAAGLWAISPLAVWSSRHGLADSLVPPLVLATLAAADAVIREAPEHPRLRAAIVAFGLSLGLLLISGRNAWMAGAAAMVAGLILGADARGLWTKVTSNRRVLLVSIAAGAGLGATCFLLTPSGLAAAVALSGQWVRGIVPGAGEYAAWELLYRLVLSEFTMLGLGLAGAVWAIRNNDRFAMGAAVASAFAWLVAIVGGGRNPLDLALVTLALALLAGPAAARVLRTAWIWRSERDPWLLVGVSAALLFAALLALPGVWNPANRADWRAIYVGIFLATTALFVVVWLAYGIWDSWSLVARTLPFVLLVFALAWQTSQMAGLSFDRAAWRRPGILHQVAAADLRDLREELRNLSALKGGGADDARIDLAWPQRPRDPALALLRWELRRFANLKVGAALPADPAPVVVSTSENEPRLVENYSGAEFPILESWRPSDLGDFNAVLRWILFREAKTTPVVTRAVLWFSRAQ